MAELSVREKTLENERRTVSRYGKLCCETAGRQRGGRMSDPHRLSARPRQDYSLPRVPPPEA